MNSIKKVVICGTYPQKMPPEFSNCLFSPIACRMGPGTKAVRFPGAPPPGLTELPGIDISRFHGGVPMSAVIGRITALSGKIGAVLHGGSYGKLISSAAHSLALYVPEPLRPESTFRTSLQSTACPLIRPAAYAVEHIRGVKAVKPLTPDVLSDILHTLRERIFFSDTHMSMYAALSIPGGFKYIFFDTPQTLRQKCALALSMGKTPFLYQEDIFLLTHQSALYL